MMTCTPMSDAELARLGTRDDAGFGALETARGHLPMTALTVEARVVGLVAETEVAQTFENTLAEPIEATYLFPLPDRAAVIRFRMEVAGRVVEGVLDERGRARETYEAAIAAGHRAAITEEDRAGVFTLRVGNLLPGEVAVVRLTLVGPLPIDEDEVTFRFPLVVAPRYIPGAALPGPRAGTGTADDTDAVPDASRITPPVLLPGCPNPVRLAIAVTIDGAGVPVGDVRSSLHAVTDEVRAGVRTIRVQPGERLDRDFVLRWTVGDAEIRSTAVVTPDADGEGGTVVVTIVPPRGATAAQRPRDVVFLLDRSGSMGGWKMVAARRAVARMVDTLGERDRFAVLAFDHAVEEPPRLPPGALTAASDRHRFRAVEFLAGIDARGGTELRDPLVRGVELLAGGTLDRDRILVLVTDGQVGNEDQILRELAARVRNVRVFTLGVDQAVNAAFLRRLAAAGGGACELVESEDRLDAVMAKVHRRIATPIVTELAVRGDGLALDEASLAPRRIPSLFAGAPVVVAGRLPAGAAAAGAIVVSGCTPSGAAWSQRIAVTEARDRGAAAASWARARIRDLEDRYAAAASPALEQEIVRTSLRHRVLSRFTAFVAVDRSEVANQGAGPRTITQAVEMPGGWAMPGAAPPPVSRSTSTLTGMAPPMKAMAPMAPMASMPPPMVSAGAMAPESEAFDLGLDDDAPAPQAPAERRSGGMLSRVRRALGGRDDAKRKAAPRPAAPPPPMKTVMLGGAMPGAPVGPAGIDRAPYLRRAGELADAIERAAAAGDRLALDLAVARLAELVEDVRSVGGLDDLAGALDAVLVAARAALADPAGAGAAWSPVARSLRDLAAGRGAPTPPRTGGGRAFWK